MSAPGAVAEADLAAAVRAALLPLARARRTVTYRDLAALVPVPPPHGIHKLTLALEDLIRADHAAGRPLVAALAVSRAGAGIPERGFFQLVADLGRYKGPDHGPPAAVAHARELDAALAYWGEAPEGSTATTERERTMAKQHTYAAKLTWTGAAQGPVRDYAGYSRAYTVAIPGKPALEGTADPMFKGDAAVHNPEDLLVAALAGCHMLTYLAHCARARIEVVAYEDDASGVMVFKGGGGRFTEVTLRPRVTVAPGGDLDEARALHDAAHRDCFIANSVNFPVRHAPEVVEAGRTA